MVNGESYQTLREAYKKKDVKEKKKRYQTLL